MTHGWRSWTRRTTRGTSAARQARTTGAAAVEAAAKGSPGPSERALGTAAVTIDHDLCLFGDGPTYA